MGKQCNVTDNIAEIKAAIREIKNNRATRPGGMHIKLIKHAITAILEIFCTIFD